MKKKLIIGVGLLAGMLLLNGCAGSTLGAPITGDDAKAKQFLTNPTKANIYVYRNGFVGALGMSHLFLNEKSINTMHGNDYTLLQVKPGKHTIKSSTGRIYEEPVITLDAKSGKNYYIWVEMKLGLLTPRSSLHLVSPKIGKAGVTTGKLKTIIR